MPKRTRARARGAGGRKGRTREPSGDLASLNAHPLNQHALALLPRWAIEPDDAQLHLLTLAAQARFASKAETAMLKKMRTEWAPTEVVDYFSRVSTFDDLFLAQHKPLEAVHVILAAVDIVAEPFRYLEPFRLVE